MIVAVGRGIGDDPTRGIEQALDLVDAFDDADLGPSRGVVTSSYSFEATSSSTSPRSDRSASPGRKSNPTCTSPQVSPERFSTRSAVTSPNAHRRQHRPGRRYPGFSDYLVEGDLFEVLPRLTEAVETGERVR